MLLGKGKKRATPNSAPSPNRITARWVGSALAARQAVPDHPTQCDDHLGGERHAGSDPVHQRHDEQRSQDPYEQGRSEGRDDNRPLKGLLRRRNR